MTAAISQPSASSAGQHAHASLRYPYFSPNARTSRTRCLTGSRVERLAHDHNQVLLRLETLPTNLLEATQELERCDVLREALGRGRDEDYVDYFIQVKRDEWARYHEQVTPWEIREYLTRF